jgi:predicted oxidoreductase
MKSFTMPGTNLVVPAVVAGMMRIQEKSDAEVRALFDAALACGINFFDHADIYGADTHGCETRFGQALRLTSAQRAEITLQSKAGIVRDGPRFDFSSEHIIAAVNGTLAALRTDYLDILLLHRPDALVEPEEVARTFDELAAAGKVRHFGVSNHTPGQIELLKRYVRQPIIANQVQLSITHAPIIAQGAAMNMVGLEQSISRDLGILDYCRLHDITVQAWSPFQASLGGGVFLDNPEYPELNAAIDRLTSVYDVPAEAIATAWLTRHPAQLQVVLGTTNPRRITAAAAGADLVLTRPEWYELYRAAGHLVP